MKIGLAQMNIKWEDKDYNRKRCINFLREGKENKVEFVLFPEMSLTGFSMNIDKIGEKNRETVECFKKLAYEFRMFIGIGYVELNGEKGENRYSILSPDGYELCSYNKIHPFSYAGEDEYYNGGKEIFTVNVKDFKVCPFICYDIRFPEIFQIASKKCSLITISANWPKKRREQWITLIKARAIENQCYVAAVNIVGEAGGIDYSGDSMIVHPDGSIINTGINEEILVTGDIHFKNIEEIREIFKLKEDRREKLYSSL